jgi:type IV secretion system protein VirD4
MVLAGATMAMALGALFLMNRRSGAPGAPQDAAGYGSHGSSRWASNDEVAAAFRSQGSGALLGRIPAQVQKRRGLRRRSEAGQDWQPVIFPFDRKQGNRFVVIFGPPGSGKTFCVTAPNVLHHGAYDTRRSIVITDPKGDLYRDTAAWMQKSGFEVLAFNLVNFDRSWAFNPMDLVQSPEDAQRLAATIVANTEGPHAGGEAFWRHSEEALIACLVWYVKATLPPEEQHLGNVLNLAGAFAADKELMDRCFQKYPATDPIRRLYAPVAGLEDKTRSGVFVGVTASRLKIWASDRIASLTAQSDFDIRQLGEKPTALYLIIPDADSTYRVLSSLFFDQVFQQLILLADEKGGRLPVECRMILEELANIGRIPDLDKRLATVRSRGFIIEMVLQTLGQLKHVYGIDAYSTILGCSDTTLVLGANDLETARYVSDLLGRTTIKTASESVTQAERGGSQGVSQQYTGRPLMTPEEIMGKGEAGLKKSEAILIQGGLQARIEKLPVDSMPEWSMIQKVSPNEAAPPQRRELKMTDPAQLAPKPAENDKEADKGRQPQATGGQKTPEAEKQQGEGSAPEPSWAPKR